MKGEDLNTITRLAVASSR